MITGAIKNKVEKIWTDIWAGGITNPLTVIEQLTYLMFIRSLDEKELETEEFENMTGEKMDKIFPQSRMGQAMRWSKFKNNDPRDIFDVISKVGGYDIAALTGAFIGGAMYGAAMVIDGFISSVAALCAEKLCPKCSDFMIASHVSKESCTADILKILGKKAPINADMCLGEGTGGMVMLTALDTALCVYNEMSTFDDINVESYKELK